MLRSYHRWFSTALGRDMELLVFGHAGARVFCFPPSLHPFYDWENRGLVHSLDGLVRNGHLQLFCVDQVDRESWYNREAHPAERARRQGQYDDYLRGEVVPFSLGMNPNPYLICAGPSMGAYHAANFALRHPHLVGRVLGMSGLYDIKRFADGYYDATVYYNNPVDFVANEHDPQRLGALRRLEVILAVGRDDPLADGNHRFSEVLRVKQMGHALRIWDGFAHDWPVWARMLPMYIGGRV